MVKWIKIGRGLIRNLFGSSFYAIHPLALKKLGIHPLPEPGRISYVRTGKNTIAILLPHTSEQVEIWKYLKSKKGWERIHVEPPALSSTP